jgi:uncharacterized membrane protein
MRKRFFLSLEDMNYAAQMIEVVLLALVTTSLAAGVVYYALAPWPWLAGLGIQLITVILLFTMLIEMYMVYRNNALSTKLKRLDTDIAYLDARLPGKKLPGE